MPGNLDQACTCLSMPQWVEYLKTCEDEDSFLTTYQSFLDTTWQAMEERSQVTDTFPYVLPSHAELLKAYYMKNRTLLVHNQLVWGPGADDDRPVVPTAKEGSQPKSSSGGTMYLLSGGSGEGRHPSDGDDGDDPNKRKSDAAPSKGDESQDPEEKKEEKEDTIQEPKKTDAEKAAQDKIDNLERQLQEARDDADRARKAAEDKAQKLGEELAQQVDDEKAKKDKKREASKGKKKRKKQKKAGAATEGEAPQPDDEAESESSDDEKPEGESKKPEGEESEDKKLEEGEDPKDKSEGEKKPEENLKPDGEEGPPKDQEPAESWTEVLKRVTKPRQNSSKAAEKARSRTYPRAMCADTAQPDHTYRSQHVPTRDSNIVGKRSVVEKTKDIPPARNPIRLKDVHKAINEHGIRKRYTDYRICVLQVLNAGKQAPPPASPFALQGVDTYWVQTTLQLHEDGSLPFSELPGMFPSLQLKGITLGVAQYVVGTFELDLKKKIGTMKPYIDNEPFWFNVEAFRAARVLLK